MQTLLLHAHEGADRNFRKEFSCGFAGQTNAAVRGRIIWHYALVHPEIKTAQSHEVGHIDMINGRTMIAFFVSDDEIAALGGIAVTTGGTGRIQNRHAVLDQRHVLRSERNFYAEMIGRRSAAEKNLRRLPMAELSREIKRDHLVTAGGAIAIGACLQQRADVIGAA